MFMWDFNGPPFYSGIGTTSHFRYVKYSQKTNSRITNVRPATKSMEIMLDNKVGYITSNSDDWIEEESIWSPPAVVVYSGGSRKKERRICLGQECNAEGWTRSSDTK